MASSDLPITRGYRTTRSRILGIYLLVTIRAPPTRPFSHSCCKQSLSANRPLGGPWVALGSPNPNPSRQRVATLFPSTKDQESSTGLWLSLVCDCSVFKDPCAFPRCHTLANCQQKFNCEIGHLDKASLPKHAFLYSALGDGQFL